MVLIASCFSPVLQGYYYTFGGVLALRVFVELGLSNVIMQFASHEWSRLRLDSQGRITGESGALSRLVSLGRVAFGWYLLAGIILALAVGIGGYLFFLEAADSGVNWVGPWIALCGLSGINLWFVPVWSLLEGSNQVGAVYAFRLTNAIVTNSATWIAVLMGAGLWAGAASAATGIAWSIVFLYWRHWPFFQVFHTAIMGPRVSWRYDVWPFQWRIALSWLSGFFIFSLFTPMMFHYHGAIIAGQMGMTWGAVSLLGAMSGVLTGAKVPRFGILIARREYTELDHLFFRVAGASIGVLVLGAIAVWLVTYSLYVLHHPFSTRLLPPLPTGLFLVGQVFMCSSSPLAAYLRAHKREPFLQLSVVSGVLVGLLTWLLGSRFGATGAGLAYFVVSAFFVLPYGVWIWRRSRVAWHSSSVDCTIRSCV